MLGYAAAKGLTRLISERFVKWSKSSQKQFLSKIGKITNRQLQAIRSTIKKSGSTKVINKSIEYVIDKYGYSVVVSAFVSSTLTSIK